MGYGYHAWSDHRPKLADFVAASHPERAAELYEQLALGLVELAGDQYYQAAVSHLKKLRPILAKLGQEDRWLALLAGIRDKQRRKRNLLAMLDRLNTKSIVSQLRR